MPRIFIHRDLIVRIDKFGFGRELKGFISAVQQDQHPPRVYKASGISPQFVPYEELELHHHHLHRDGDPLLITQHIEGEIYGIALATHETYFGGDKMLWLKENAEAIDWSSCPALMKKVLSYDPFHPDENIVKCEPVDQKDDPSSDIPF